MADTITLTAARLLLDDISSRAGGNTSDWSLRMKDHAIRSAMIYANQQARLIKTTTSLTLAKNSKTIDLTAVDGFDASGYIDAHLSDGTTSISDGGTSYAWTLSGSGSTEFYLRTGTSDPGLEEPDDVWANSLLLTKAAIGSLAVSNWNFGDNDSLGYDTVYVELADSADPDAKASGFVTYTNQTVPVELRDWDEVRQAYQAGGAGTSRGTSGRSASHYVGFQTKQTGMIYPSMERTRKMTIEYLGDVVSWTMGVSDGSGVTLNIPIRYLYPIITLGAVPLALTGDPSHDAQGAWSEFKLWVKSIRGRGTAGGRVTYKTPLNK